VARIADNGVDKYGQKWMNVEKSTGSVLAALILLRLDNYRRITNPLLFAAKSADRYPVDLQDKRQINA
jgi:hypothetical protein